MIQVKKIFIAIFINFIFIVPVMADEFDWLDNLNVSAQADSSGFRMQLATRFKVGSAEVNAVINNVNSPSDAYMVLRLGEMSHKPMQEILHVYHRNKGRAWGVIAKQLGIKPGSQAFHALKRGHDLYENKGHHSGPANHARKGNSKVKHASKGNGKGKWK